jgi:hypothetical protein
MAGKKTKKVNGNPFLIKYVSILLKVSKSQNKNMKSSFLPKNERNIARISALTFRPEIWEKR